MAGTSNESRILNSKTNLGAKSNLEKLLQLEKPIALVGAGLSMPAGMPSWNELLNHMDKRLGALDDGYMELLRNDPDLLWRAEEYRHLLHNLDETFFQTIMTQEFGKKVKFTDSDPSLLFVSLPFRHFMTTNYDDVLTDAHAKNGLPEPRRLNWYTENDVRTFVYNLRDTTRRNILHLHGHHSIPQSLILSDSDYASRYDNQFGTAVKLFAIFSTERVVFAGFSLNDPYLQSMLRGVNASMGRGDPRHFAILGLNKPETEMLERKRLLHRYGIDPVFYDSTGNNHEGLLEILRDLSEAATREFSEGREYDVLPPDSWSSGGTLRAVEVTYPDDPERGRWGGRAESKGRKLTAKVREIEAGWFEVTMKVVATPKSAPLTGSLIFHLHPTFVPSVRVVEPNDAKTATLTLQCYGAFTVGVEADNGTTHLELNLAKLKDAPLMFRIN